MAQQLRGAGAKPYSVTSDDVLWLLRAVEAEGPDSNEVAQTLLNGFVWARASGRWRKTLADWVCAYAQPVNARWFYPKGDLYLDELAELEPNSPDAHNATAKAIHRAEVLSTRVEFSPSTRAAVARALTGVHDIPRNATDYAAAKLNAARKGYRPLSPATPGRNRLWSRPGAFTWQGFTSSSSSIDNVWPFVAAVVLAAAVWQASKGGSRAK